MVWSKKSLHDLARETLSDHRFIVVSNREPYIHRRKENGIECVKPASGMATAIDPMMRACGGIWIAHGSGDADRECADSKGRLPVPPENPMYTLRRVWLTKDQERGYYYGLANRGLWPLCHVAFRRPIFKPADWRHYRHVNRIFSEAVLEEAADGPAFVFIQDYHFALLPRILKSRNPKLIVAQFWHIPWPNREIFRAFPWQEELLDGLLGNDLLGFHLRYHCQNFLDTVDRCIEAKVDQERAEIIRAGRMTAVRAFPISIDFEAYSAEACSARMESEIKQWHERLRLEGLLVGLGIDRVDYTKGIPERLLALELFLEHHPEYRKKICFIQVAVPSRTQITEYRRLDAEIATLVDQINSRWGDGTWKPIHLLKGHLNSTAMIALHRTSDFCMVTSLHDGMNLVAKEFVSSRFDEGGVLILSRFTGSARELLDALLVNPFDLEQCASAIYHALQMPALEKKRRMQRMRAVVAKNNVYRWAAKLIAEIVDFHDVQNAWGESEKHGMMED
jgi:alpha,alpha-trehalose-phosphate synthase [UDP-forming]